MQQNGIVFSAGLKQTGNAAPNAESFRSLELIVNVLNANAGHNEIILEKCGSLRGHAVFVERICKRRRAGRMLEDVISDAIDYCIENRILVEYLKRNGSEGA